MTAIVVGGTSQGAVAAFAYGAAHATLAGIVGMAPAADAVDPSKYPDFAKSLETARTLVAAGKGDTATDLTDIVSGGKDVDIKATPKAFLTFHGPDSPIATIRSLMATTLPKLKMPVLWVAGTRDDSQGIAPRAFAAVPRNGLNRYVTVDANHAQTPDVAAPAVLAWLKTLQ